MAEAQAAEETGGSKKNLVLFAAILLLAVGASIGGTLYFLGGEETAEEAQPAEDTRPDKAIYHSLRPAFIVNYVTGGKPRYLQTELTVMARDPAVIEALIDHMPLVRSQIVNFLADQEVAVLQTHTGKQQLRESLLVLMDEVLMREEQIKGVQSVLLTSFVMQ